MTRSLVFRVAPVRCDPPDAISFACVHDMRAFLALCSRGLLSTEQRDVIQERAETTGRSLLYCVGESGFVPEHQLLDFLSNGMRVPSIDLREYDLEVAVVRLVPRGFAVSRMLIPVNRPERQVLVIAMVNPADIDAINCTRFATGLQIEVVVATGPAVLDAIERFYPMAH